MNIMTLYSTFPDMKTGRKIVNVLLKKRLIACANLFKVESSYAWKGKKIQHPEVAVLCKTSSKRAVYAAKELEKMHPYAVPCIEQYTVKTTKKYAQWVNHETQ